MFFLQSVILSLYPILRNSLGTTLLFCWNGSFWMLSIVPLCWNGTVLPGIIMKATDNCVRRTGTLLHDSWPRNSKFPSVWLDYEKIYSCVWWCITPNLALGKLKQRILSSGQTGLCMRPWFKMEVWGHWETVYCTHSLIHIIYLLTAKVCRHRKHS